MKLPTITIITLLYNPDYRVYALTLKALRAQTYPRSHIEHLVMDGGSLKKYLTLSSKYGGKVITRKDLARDVLVRSKIALQMAKGDIILFLEPDNILIGKNWLYEMVKPFIDDQKIVGTYSMYNSAEKYMPMLTRYTALLGINDPTVYYLGKSEKLTRFETEYMKGKKILSNEKYDVVEFNLKNLPVLGDNGHMVRRKIIVPIVTKMDQFLHTDAFMIACKKGYVRYGVVRNSIVHHTGSSFTKFFGRRITYKGQFYDCQRQKRQYYVYNNRNTQDRRNLQLFILYSLTLVEPLLFSIRGYVAIHDIAWFLHPVVCFGSVISYGISEMKHVLRIK